MEHRHLSTYVHAHVCANGKKIEDLACRCAECDDSRGKPRFYETGDVTRGIQQVGQYSRRSVEAIHRTDTIQSPLFPMRDAAF